LVGIEGLAPSVCGGRGAWDLVALCQAAATAAAGRKVRGTPAAATRPCSRSPGRPTRSSSRGDERGEVDPGVEPFRLQQVDQVLGRGVAHRARREGAAAEAAERRVEAAHALLQRRQGVGQRRAERVVQVQVAEPLRPDLRAHGPHQAPYLGGGGVAQRVGERDHVRAGLGQCGSEFDHVALRHRALQRAAEGSRDAALDARRRGAERLRRGDHARHLGDLLGAGAADV
jgi:hypothetical protein